ncbi:hypothetical protein HDU76_011345, partial [Blyttiomyces sp. JEL0837]
MTISTSRPGTTLSSCEGGKPNVADSPQQTRKPRFQDSEETEEFTNLPSIEKESRNRDRSSSRNNRRDADVDNDDDDPPPPPTYDHDHDDHDLDGSSTTQQQRTRVTSAVSTITPINPIKKRIPRVGNTGSNNPRANQHASAMKASMNSLATASSFGGSASLAGSQSLGSFNSIQHHHAHHHSGGHGPGSTAGSGSNLNLNMGGSLASLDRKRGGVRASYGSLMGMDRGGPGSVAGSWSAGLNDGTGGHGYMSGIHTPGGMSTSTFAAKRGNRSIGGYLVLVLSVLGYGVNRPTHAGNLREPTFQGVFRPKFSRREDSEIYVAKFSLDEDYVAIGLGNSAIQIYSTRSNDFVRTLAAPVEAERYPCTTLAFRPESTAFKNKGIVAAGCGQYSSLSSDGNTLGKRFATCGSDGYVRVYDGATHKRVAKMISGKTGVCAGHSSRVFSVKFHPTDTNILVSGGWDNTLQVWDTRVQHSIRSIYGPHICGDSIDFDDSGDKILTGSFSKEDQLQIWSFTSGKVIENVSWSIMDGDRRNSKIYSAGFGHARGVAQANKNIIAGGSGVFNDVKMFSITSKRAIGMIQGFKQSVYTVALSPNEKMVAVRTTTAVVPTEVESLTLVKNLMQATISAIAYLRGLFPEENFEDSKVHGLLLKKIERGVSDEANELMDWMEKGCYDALEKRYLKTMIFGVYMDPEHPEDLIESYTFGFSYPGKNQWCISINDSQKETYKMKNKQEIIKVTRDLLRRVLVLTQTLRPLPENANLAMRLYYYDDVTPIDYEPPLFRAANENDPHPAVANADNYHMGQVETPHHTLHLRITTAKDSLVPDEENVQFAHELLDDPNIKSDSKNAPAGPSQQKQSHETRVSSVPPSPNKATAHHPALSDLGARPDVGSASGAVSAAGLRASQRQHHGHSHSQHDLMSMGSSMVERSEADPALGSNLSQVSNLTYVMETMALRDGNVKDKGKAIACVGVGGGNGMSARTMGAVRGDRNGEDVAMMDSMDIQTDAAPDGTVKGASDVDFSVPETQETIDEKPDGAANEERSISHSRIGDGDVINCPCGTNEIDGDMLQCSRCETWGHSVCFGYIDDGDPRLNTEDHACYKCVNTMMSFEAYSPEEAAEVAIVRRGLVVAWFEGIKNITSFSKRLGVGLGVAMQVITRLIKESVVTARKRNKSRNSGTVYEVVKNMTTQSVLAKWMSSAVIPQKAVPMGVGYTVDTGKVPRSSPPGSPGFRKGAAGMPKTKGGIGAGIRSQFEEEQALRESQIAMEGLVLVEGTPDLDSMKAVKEEPMMEVVSNSQESIVDRSTEAAQGQGGDDAMEIDEDNLNNNNKENV